MSRTLAIAPGTKHLGFAVFEGTELVRFGVRTFRGRKRTATFVPELQRYIGELIVRSRANVLVVEDVFYVQARQSAMLQRMIRELKEAATRKGVKVRSILPTAVKARFCREKGTRQKLANVMADRYPFLKRMRERQPRNYWQQLFDAVALGTYVHKEEDALSQGNTSLVDTSLSAKT